MANKKQQQKHDHKKQPPATPQQIDSTLIEQQLAHYQDIAQALSKSGYGETESVLEPITGLEEATQIAFLKALSKEHTIEAANVLAAINTFAPAKEPRKEARRSLIRLQEARIFPEWTPPAAPTLTQVIEDVFTAKERRFWKGIYSNSRDVGEVHLSLFWEQGERFKEVLIMNFLLEFYTEGVKDFFTDVTTKHRAEKRLQDMRIHFSEMGLIECSLAEARRLIAEALEVNAETGANIPSDYTRNLPLVRELVLDVPEDDERLKGALTRLASMGGKELIRRAEERNAAEAEYEAGIEDEEDEDEEEMDETSIEDLFPMLEELLGSTSTEAENAVEDFLTIWVSEDDLDLAYDYLSDDSPLRENRSEEDWITWRERWQEEAHPHALRLDAIVERDKDEDSQDEAVIVDAFWSLQYDETPPGNAPIELPMPTLTLAETGRHWFWTSYTVIPNLGNTEDDEIHIQSMTDEGAKILSLSLDELRGRITALQEMVDEHLAQENAITDDDIEEMDEENFNAFEQRLGHDLKAGFRALEETLFYNDALIAQEPLSDPEIYWQAYKLAGSTQDPQRSAAYLQRIAENVAEQRGPALSLLAMLYSQVAEMYEEPVDEEDYDDDDEFEAAEQENQKQTRRFKELAEQTFRAALAVEDNPIENVVDNSLGLVELLLGQNRQLDEAKELLQRVQTQTTDAPHLALIEKYLGDIAARNEDRQQALSHYQRVAEIEPDFHNIWALIGTTQMALGQPEQAIASFQKNIELTPENSKLYQALALLYLDQNTPNLAREVLKQGLKHAPDSADLLATLSIAYLRGGDLRSAEKYLEQAEDIDEDLDIVQTASRALQEQKKQRQGIAGKMKFPKKK